MKNNDIDFEELTVKLFKLFSSVIILFNYNCVINNFYEKTPNDS